MHVKDGVATWTGTTSIMQHKGAATRMAKRRVAFHVVNNIQAPRRTVRNRLEISMVLRVTCR